MAQRPIESLRSFPIEVAIWEQDGKEGRKFYNVTCSRSYKNSEGKYMSTPNLNKNDLLLAARLLGKAHDVIVELESAAHARSKGLSEGVPY